ncbi:MAG: Gldg family protein [Leptospiraceae bacterium]|nr:Gldg family protein [Leptospiraceae bacterium]MCP5495401.1 Gldg family protein [Leptospiraceae bacterium]
MFYLKNYLPFLSLVSLFLFFLTNDMFINKQFKALWFIVLFVFLHLDIINRFIESKKNKEKVSGIRYVTAFSGTLSILMYQLREYLDFPALAGVAKQATYLPKLRDFLLLLIVLTSLQFLVFTIVLEISRQSMDSLTALSKEKRTLLQNSFYSFLIIIPLLVGINYVAVNRNYNFDLSSKGIYSFSPISKNIIKNIKKDIKITAFYPRPLESSGPGNSLALSLIRPEVQITLEQLQALNPLIQVRFLNADVETDLIGDFGQASNGSIYIRTLKSGVVSSKQPYAEQRLVVQEKKDLEDFERKLIQALLNVSTEVKNARFTSSNGERFGLGFKNAPNEQITNFVAALNFLNYSVQGIGINEGWPDKLSDDIDILAIIGPTIPFSENARASILNFIQNKNGKVLITIDPNGSEDFSWLLEKAALEFKNEMLSQTEGKPGLIRADKFPVHPITELIHKKDLGIYFPNSGYFSEKKLEGSTTTQFDFTNILESGYSSFVDENKNGKLDNSESRKNFTVGVLLTNSTEESEKPKEKNNLQNGKVILFSGTSWVTDQYFYYNANPYLAVNGFSWLNQNISLEGILPRKEDTKVDVLTENQKLTVWAIGIFVFPTLVGLISSIFLIRKKWKKSRM